MWMSSLLNGRHKKQFIVLCIAILCARIKNRTKCIMNTIWLYWDRFFICLINKATSVASVCDDVITLCFVVSFAILIIQLMQRTHIIAWQLGAVALTTCSYYPFIQLFAICILPTNVYALHDARHSSFPAHSPFLLLLCCRLAHYFRAAGSFAAWRIVSIKQMASHHICSRKIGKTCQ